MHTVARNRKPVWYANLLGVEHLTEDGLYTGQYKETYTVPKKLMMSVAISSGANNLGSQGMAELQRYGITTAYTHRLVTEDMNCPISEESIIWYGKTPGKTFDAIPHNFKVVRRSASLNHVIYYLKEVDVDAEPSVSN